LGELTLRADASSVRIPAAVSSTHAHETIPRADEAILPARENSRKHRQAIKITGQQWSSIMWHVIISLIYRQACRSYLAAARKQRAWA
jgi:hypothetical protein